MLWYIAIILMEKKKNEENRREIDYFKCIYIYQIYNKSLLILKSVKLDIYKYKTICII